MVVESLVKRHGKGFKRTRKEWENSIADHIGKFVDRVKLKDVLEAISMGTAAYYGFKAIPEDAPVEAKLGGTAFAMISLKLATAPNMVSGAAGVAGLAGIGLSNAVGPEFLKAPWDAWVEFYKTVNEFLWTPRRWPPV